jgi:hypothetical protein
MRYNIIEYTDEQRKEYINSEHIYSIYLQKYHTYHNKYKYSLYFTKDKKGQYRLVKKHSKSGKVEYLGYKDDKSIKIYEDFKLQKEQAKIELENSLAKLIKQQKLNKFIKLSRTPNVLVKIFRKLNELKLEDKIIVIGTNAIYSYESACGVFVEPEYLATIDIDLLSKKEKKLSFLFKELMSEPRLSELIKEIDKSFRQQDKIPYTYINKDGVIIDLINPMSKSIRINGYDNDNGFTDIIALDMDGIQWLENSKLFRSLIVSQNGEVAYMKTIHPVEFAIYKNWLSQNSDRIALKRPRDLAQSQLVTHLIDKYLLNIDLDKELKNIKHFKKEVVDSYIKNNSSNY